MFSPTLLTTSLLHHWIENRSSRGRALVDTFGVVQHKVLRMDLLYTSYVMEEHRAGRKLCDGRAQGREEVM